MPNIITEIEQSLNEVPPLKIDIKPVMQTAPAPDPLSGVQPVSIPQAAPPPLTPPQPSAPIQPVTSTGSPVPEIPQVDALSYGDTISRMSAESAAEIQKTIQSAGAPKFNDVQKQLLSPSTPVHIDTKLSSQSNPFAGNKPENAQERLAFEPPVLANGLRNPFSDPNARAAIAAGISREEYLAYIRDIRAKGDESDTFGTPITPSSGYIDEYGQVQGKIDNTTGSFTGLNAEQIRRKMAERGGYLSARRNFNAAFLPFSGSENRSELETLFAALSFPANLVKGIGLDATRGIASVVSGGFNIDQIKRDYEAMRPTRGGTFTGAAVLGEQFNSMAVVDQKGAPYNPLAVVRDDSNVFQAILGFGLDVLADPLNNDKVAQLLFKPVGLFQKVNPAVTSAERVVQEVSSQLALPSSPTLLSLPPARDFVPTQRLLEGSLDTAIPVKFETVRTGNIDRPIVLPELRVPEKPVAELGSPLPNLSVVDKPVLPDLSSISFNVASEEQLRRFQPTRVEFPEPVSKLDQALSRLPAPEVNMYNNVTALFNDSKELPTVQRFMRDVVEQKPFEQIPDARALVVVQNPVLREVAEFARTGDLTPNIAVLQGAPPSDVAAIVADKLALVQEQPLVVPKLVQAPIEVPRLEFDVTRQLPRKLPEVKASPQLPVVPELQNRSLPDILLKRLEQDRLRIPESPAKTEAFDFSERVLKGEVPTNPKLLEENKVEVVGNIKKELGGTDAEAVKLANDYYVAAKNILDSPDTQIFINVDQKVLPDVFSNGMRNAFEVVDEYKNSKQYVKTRKFLERSVNGIPNNPDIPSYVRPLYGYIDSVSQIESQTFPKFGNSSGHLSSRFYGDTTIQLKASAKNRSSFTVGDSLNEHGGQTASVPISSLDSASPWASAFYKEGATKAKQLPKTVEDLVHYRNYLEAQIYGGINIDDIAAIYFRKEPLPEVLRAAFDRDIKVYLNGKQLIDEGVPVPVSKPVVVSEPPFTSLSDLMDDARDGGITSMSEVRNWTQKGDFITPLKDIPNAVDDLGIDALNTPSLMRVVKARIGGLKDKAVKEVAQSLVKVELKNAEDIAKSLFNALWRKSTDEQKQLILSTVPVKRLNELGLERTVTEVVPPSLPTLSHVRASAIDESVVSAYRVVNDSQARMEDLRVAALLEQGVPRRRAIGMRDHPLMLDIMILQKMRDKYFDPFMKSKELSVASPAERDWSSAMLKHMWEVATPEQKVRIMSEIDARTLEQLGFERIARSNVIDDHLPVEKEFDIPC